MDEGTKDKDLIKDMLFALRGYLGGLAVESKQLMFVFGVVLFINYPLFYAIWVISISKTSGYESLFLRILASTLCIPLIFNRYWPKSKFAWLSAYWYGTACYCLPFFFTFMLLKNGASTIWLMNCISAVFFLMLVFDFIAAIFLLVAGSLLGIIAFYLTSTAHFSYHPGLVDFESVLVTFLAAIIIGALFSRSKQKIETIWRKSKDAELKNVLARYKNFVLNQEHDIRTPVAGVTGLAGALLGRLSDPENVEIAQYLYQSAQAQQAYQNSLIDSIYLFKDTTDKYYRRFEPRKKIKEVEDIYASSFHEKKINFELFYDDEIPKMLVGDWFRLQQVLVCLLSNAVKFTEDGGKVSMRCKLIDKDIKKVTLAIDIEDNGTGIEHDMLDVIFEPFARLTLSNIGKYEGRGLGLTFVKKLVDDLNGEIDVSSEPGQGSIFRILVCYDISLSSEPTSFLSQ